MQTDTSFELMPSVREGYLSGKILLQKLLIVLFAFFIVKPSAAQDIIILNSGRQIKARIVDEDTIMIRYRDYGDRNGPLYNVEKRLVADVKYSRETIKAREAKPVIDNKKADAGNVSEGKSSELLTVKARYVFKDGMKVSPRNVKDIMEDDPESLKLYENGYKLCKMSNACPVGIILVSTVSSLTANRYEEQSDRMKILIPALAVDGALIVASIILSSSGKSKIRQSVELYNSRINQPGPLSVSVMPSITGNGIGLVVKF